MKQKIYRLIAIILVLGLALTGCASKDNNGTADKGTADKGTSGKDNSSKSDTKPVAGDYLKDNLVTFDTIAKDHATIEDTKIMEKFDSRDTGIRYGSLLEAARALVPKDKELTTIGYGIKDIVNIKSNDGNYWQSQSRVIEVADYRVWFDLAEWNTAPIIIGISNSVTSRDIEDFASGAEIARELFTDDVVTAALDGEAYGVTTVGTVELFNGIRYKTYLTCDGLELEQAEPALTSTDVERELKSVTIAQSKPIEQTYSKYLSNNSTDWVTPMAIENNYAEWIGFNLGTDKLTGLEYEKTELKANAIERYSVDENNDVHLQNTECDYIAYAYLESNLENSNLALNTSETKPHIEAFIRIEMNTNDITGEQKNNKSGHLWFDRGYEVNNTWEMLNTIQNKIKEVGSEWISKETGESDIGLDWEYNENCMQTLDGSLSTSEVLELANKGEGGAPPFSEAELILKHDKAEVQLEWKTVYSDSQNESSNYSADEDPDTIRLIVRFNLL